MQQDNQTGGATMRRDNVLFGAFGQRRNTTQKRNPLSIVQSLPSLELRLPPKNRMRVRYDEEGKVIIRPNHLWSHRMVDLTVVVMGLSPDGTEVTYRYHHAPKGPTETVSTVKFRELFKHYDLS